MNRTRLPAGLLLACASLALSPPAVALAGHARGPRSHSARHVRHARVACHSARHARPAQSNAGCVAKLHRLAGARRHRRSAPYAAPAVAQSAEAHAATIARVLASSCEDTQLTPEASNLEAARTSVLCLINHERARADEMPLTSDARLQAAAQSHVDELIAQDYFAHISPSGVTPVDRIRADGYIPGPEFGYLIGENLAWGTLSLSTPQAIVEAWMNSPEHRANILEAHYGDTGIALTPAVPASLSDGQPGATYAQEFGAIIS